jgi:multidrug efflux pump subunit AcrA (membrane-fusion protein)
MKRINLIGIAAVASLIAAVALTGCAAKADAAKGEKKTKDGKAAPAAAPVFAVNTTTAVKGQIRDYLALSGDLVAGSTVDVYSDVAGKVTKLYVSVGDRVAKDAPLADVDPSRPGMTYVAGVAKAPIAGTIVALPVQIGTTVSQAAPIARLSRTDALELRTYVAERFVSKMKLGLRAEVSLEAYPGRVFPAVVKELSPILDPASRTMEVRLDVYGDGARLKAGMFAKVKVITEDKQGIVKLPATAVVKRFGESYVFVVETDPTDPAFRVARKRAVVSGILIDDKLEVTSGVAAGEEIIVRGQTLLEDGTRVNVVERVAPLGAAD